MRRKLKRLMFRLLPFNRRRYPRFVASLPVKGVCRYREGTAQLACPCFMVDVSRGGVLITTGHTKVFPDTTVELSFDLAADLEPFTVKGMVLRTYLQGFDSEVHSSIEFVNPDDAAVKGLLDFVANKATVGRARRTQ